jgi:hypothetical protein
VGVLSRYIRCLYDFRAAHFYDLRRIFYGLSLSRLEGSFGEKWDPISVAIAIGRQRKPLRPIDERVKATPCEKALVIVNDENAKSTDAFVVQDCSQALGAV